MGWCGDGVEGRRRVGLVVVVCRGVPGLMRAGGHGVVWTQVWTAKCGRWTAAVERSFSFIARPFMDEWGGKIPLMTDERRLLFPGWEAWSALSTCVQPGKKVWGEC